MSQVSKYLISKDVADRIFDVFIKALIRIRNNDEAQKLANDLFSPTERIMLAKRLAIAFLLMKGYEYRQISKLIRVSLTTIASVSLSLKYGSNGYTTILQRIAKEEKLEEFFLNAAKSIFALPLDQAKGGGAWRSLRADVQKVKDKRLQRQF